MRKTILREIQTVLHQIMLKENVYSRLYSSERNALMDFIEIKGAIGDFEVLRRILFERHRAHACYDHSVEQPAKRNKMQHHS
jgi:hypothetical protein